MTEAEWLTATDPVALVKWLWLNVSERKRRLYIVAGCYHNQHLLHHPEHSWPSILDGERIADESPAYDGNFSINYCAEVPTWGNEFHQEMYELVYPTEEERAKALHRAVEKGAVSSDALTGGPWAVNEAVAKRLTSAARLAELCSGSSGNYDRVEHVFLFRDMCAVDWPGRWLVDCMFGNPFRPVTFAREWRTETAVALAQAMYDDREFGNLPILADALQDAGCENDDVLDHCRGPGPHVRGCWVVDLVLGKE